MSCDTDAYIASKIAQLKLTIDAAMDAEAAIMLGTVQQYSFNTGQTVQVVTKFNITELRKYIDSLFNRLATWNARVYGCGVVIARPVW